MENRLGFGVFLALRDPVGENPSLQLHRLRRVLGRRASFGWMGNPMKRTFVSVIVVALSVLVSGVVLAETKPFAGTWKLNTAKSKYSPGPTPQSLTLRFEAQSNGIKSSNEATAADGTHTAWSYTANYDGKDNPVSGTGAPGGANTVALKLIDPNTTEATFKKAGKVVRTARLVVSKDGKVISITTKGTNPDGAPMSAVLVLDKQ